MILLRNGSESRNAPEVRGARSCSSRAMNSRLPLTVMRRFISDFPLPSVEANRPNRLRSGQELESDPNFCCKQLPATSNRGLAYRAHADEFRRMRLHSLHAIITTSALAFAA